MPMPDKRDECGCHRDCTMLPHECVRPCRWPDCLTDAEHEELAAEVMREP
jgi:hypothetical protein